MVPHTFSKHGLSVFEDSLATSTSSSKYAPVIIGDDGKMVVVLYCGRACCCNPRSELWFHLVLPRSDESVHASFDTQRNLSGEIFREEVEGFSPMGAKKKIPE